MTGASLPEVMTAVVTGMAVAAAVARPVSYTHLRAHET